MGQDGEEEDGGEDLMIVPMKKVWILIRPGWADEVIALLEKAGMLHVSHVEPTESDDISRIREEMELLGEALSIMKQTGAGRGGGNGEMSRDEALDAARRVMELSGEMKGMREEISGLKRELEEIGIWGDFDPKEAGELKGVGIDVILFSCRENELGRIPEDAAYSVIERVEGRCYCAAFSMGRLDIPFKKIPLPASSPLEMEEMIREKGEELSRLEEEITGLAGPALEDAFARLEKKLDFEEVRSGMGIEEGVAYIRGFVPEEEAGRITRLATGKGWGAVVVEPEEDDPVPTLVRHSKLSALFQPVMSFIGITPGYFEYDTNAIFLVFFSIFFAMIAGDGGYGLILLAAVFAASRLMPTLSREGVRLFYLLSGATLLWGAVTGNWFGLSASGVPLLGDMAIPGLSAVDAASDETVMEICFALAFLHLSAAHVWKGLRYYPSLRAISEGGWVLLLSGIYLLTRSLILKEGGLEPSFYLILSGFTAIIVFSAQRGDGFLRGLLLGLKGLPVSALDGVGGLSNMVSYVRLFAVGMASREVAAAFNSLAGGVGFDGPFSVAAAIFILVFGHAVNMLLIAMSVIVHGIRLNILEFSGHMNIEWSGIPYRPLGGNRKKLSTGNPEVCSPP
ncbi:MAG: hypothetical protein RQ824_07020 [bacterium]|nr:hypothetical protein [bacterium]